jgi:hypothetical protein
VTVLILALLRVWIGIGAVFRLIGLVIRLVVMIALASAICAEIEKGDNQPLPIGAPSQGQAARQQPA